ncbi:hypothetical protein CEUSTIGMA_g3671.t1 [Chlamydomonas eustigma]|uniref:Misato Segment II tubulin-like domain-containing protein n=1 Tax=Chlamydomonas eustigma TaxID=1157962 RepID=A0A250WZG1_9CHLO|nr:hypothetical protein CEUSTIGMA_g3671.t1 [Chlamydomonas eustigma]|eukprot:GAX76227.1 hypothetical protein CEUSTIGMA_g3671.t1 [Chlamydomonas eustigma]
MPGHDLITLSLGNYSNYVAAHFWNIQDELLGYTDLEDWTDLSAVIDSTVLFNIKENRQGALSYHPRALFVDLSGSLGGVSLSDSVGAAATESISTWGGRLQVHQADLVPKSSFLKALEEHAALDGSEEDSVWEARQAALEEAAINLDLRDTVSAWTDYLKAPLTSSLVYTIPGIWKGINEFTSYCDGVTAMSGDGPAKEAKEEISDRVRVLSEQSDGLQGFQVLTEDKGGFGSITQRLLEELREEYSNRDVLLFSVRPPSNPAVKIKGMEEARSAANDAMALSTLPELCSMYVPLAVPWSRHAFPHLIYKTNSHFQTSAILASAIDSFTLPARLTPGCPQSRLGSPLGAVSLHSLVQLMRGRGGPNLVAGSLCMPCPSVETDLQALQAHRDDRMRGGPRDQLGESASGQVNHKLTGMADPVLTSVSSCTTMLSPGLVDVPSQRLVESITLRGALKSESYFSAGESEGGGGQVSVAGAPGSIGVWKGGRASVSETQQALDYALLHGHGDSDARMCVRHRTVVPMPLPVPLPFPSSLFAPEVGGLLGKVYRSAAVASAADFAEATVDRTQPQPHNSSWGRAYGQQPVGHRRTPIATAPLLARLLATEAFSTVLDEVCVKWKETCRSAAGASLLDTWGYSPCDAQEVGEVLQGLASSYHDSDSEL